MAKVKRDRNSRVTSGRLRYVTETRGWRRVARRPVVSETRGLRYVYILAVLRRGYRADAI